MEAEVGLNYSNILQLLFAVYGLLAAIVKLVPTLKKGILLDIIKLLGKITNRTTPDDEIRTTISGIEG